METKDNIVGIRLDDSSLERLDALAEKLGKNRSATLRRLLWFVDRELGPEGNATAFSRWNKKLDARPLF